MPRLRQTLLLTASLALLGVFALHARAAAPRPHAHRATNGPATVVWTRPVHYRDAVVVLMYHNLGEPERGDTISPARFAAEIAALKAAHFNFLTLAEFERELHGRFDPPPNAVLLTFDDGLPSLWTEAFPILHRDKVPAVAFLIVGRVGSQTAVNWPEVERMKASGLIAFASHTYDMHGGVAVSPTRTSAATVAHAYSFALGRPESDAAYRARVGRDLRRAKLVLDRRLGQRTTAFAYPFGAYDPELIALLRQAGYDEAFTTWGGAVVATSDPFRLPRINVGTPATSAADIAAVVAVVGAHDRAQPPAAVVPNWP
jgi:biofilm PGA synthesis lipoprotein PgaB